MKQEDDDGPLPRGSIPHAQERLAAIIETLRETRAILAGLHASL